MQKCSFVTGLFMMDSKNVRLKPTRLLAGLSSGAIREASWHMSRLLRV